uniref:Large ribosomal subunit protein uL24m n=1 Tax=Glossina palpalis gambiensis TaxID=67801 RepID=A0A1B0AT69_9MUSC
MRLVQCLRSKLKDFSNFPKEYVERSKRQVYFETPRARNYLPRTVERKKYRYTTNRPWTEEWGYFRGDRVEVLVGKDKGKQGFITQVITERNWVICEGLNWHYRTVAAEKGFPGILIKSEAPLDVTKDIRLIDPSDLQGCEWEWRYTEEGEMVRVSTRTYMLDDCSECIA